MDKWLRTDVEKSSGVMDLRFLNDMVRFSLGRGLGRWRSIVIAR